MGKQDEKTTLINKIKKIDLHKQIMSLFGYKGVEKVIELFT